VRQQRGLTQAELGKLVDVSQRVVAYYEADGAQPPGALLADLARALKVSADELLGLKAVTEKTTPKAARLLSGCRRSPIFRRLISGPY
jgi:transcriptional regulator with XRE-family HTH domain